MTATTTSPSSQAPWRAGLARARRRSSVLVRLGWIRARMRVLGVLAPAAADRLALDLWCALPGSPSGRDRHRTSGGVVRRLSVPRGGTVAAETWGAGPVVYLVHGWGGWRGQLGAFVEPLVATGHRVVAVDAPSHGDSDDGVMGHRRGTVMEMIETLEVARREFGPAAGVVAHSLGCTVAGQVVAAGLPVERLVLIAPNHRFEDLLDEFAHQLGLSRRTSEHLRAELERLIDRPLATLDLASLGTKSAMPDTLVVHDRTDKETPYRIGAQLATTWPTARLVTTEGLGHRRILADPGVVQQVVRYIG
ncbi:MAG: alpha/beta fold hydrolase [Cellulomonas sp.]